MLKALFKILGTIVVLPCWAVSMYVTMALSFLVYLPILFILDSAGVKHRLRFNPEGIVDFMMGILDKWKAL
jgi:hypothetical protein